MPLCMLQHTVYTWQHEQDAEYANLHRITKNTSTLQRLLTQKVNALRCEHVVTGNFTNFFFSSLNLIVGI